MTRIAGRLLIEGELRLGTLVLAGERIAAVELAPGAADASAAALPIVAPGLIDLHVHGFGGFGPLDALEGMARALARAGTTAFQPTLFPTAPERLGELCAELAASAARARGGAAVLGAHLEGPFVSPLAAGALPIADLAVPSVAALRAILGAPTGGGRGVRTMTIAPELEGSAACIAELVRAGVRVSLGHSRANAAVARAAVRAGARGATHLYNAMTGVHHREAGLAGIALTDELVFAEIIGDLAHVGPEAFELALRARGPRGLCLVSDALAGAGTGCSVFHALGREHLVRDGTAYYPAGPEGGEPRLAGTAMSQLEMVRRLVTRGVVGVADALTMASEAPALALSLESERGRLVPGARADLIVLRGAELALERVLVGGVEL